MTESRPSTATNLATVGLALGGPVTLLSGILMLVTVPTGVTPAFVVIFMSAAAVTALSALVYLAERMKAGEASRSADNDRTPK